MEAANTISCVLAVHRDNHEEPPAPTIDIPCRALHVDERSGWIQYTRPTAHREEDEGGSRLHYPHIPWNREYEDLVRCGGQGPDWSGVCGEVAFEIRDRWSSLVDGRHADVVGVGTLCTRWCGGRGCCVRRAANVW